MNARQLGSQLSIDALLQTIPLMVLTKPLLILSLHCCWSNLIEHTYSLPQYHSSTVYAGSKQLISEEGSLQRFEDDIDYSDL